MTGGLQAPSDYHRRNPWVVSLRGGYEGRRAARKTAMNVVDRPYRAGLARVAHARTGEAWERRNGSWFKVTPPRPRGKGGKS